MDDETKKRIDQATAMVKEMNDHLISKGRIFLEVHVRNSDEAEQIMQWMYGQEENWPMKAHLQQVAWDKELVPADVLEALRKIQEAVL